MPIFDYRCKQCGHSFDALQKLGDEPLTRCPECGKAAMEKLVSAPALQLKGGAKGGAGHSHSHGGQTHSHGGCGCGHKH